MTKLTISTKVKCSLKTAWEVYSEGRHMTMWDFVSDEWQCPSAETDLRVGGKLKARMEAKDGSFGFDFEAIYNEVVPRKRLVFTLADGRRTEVDFTKEKKYVRLTVNFDMLKESDRTMQKNAWTTILENYRKYAESLE